MLHKVREVGKKPNTTDYLREGKIDLAVNIPLVDATEHDNVLKNEYAIRRLAIEYNNWF